MTTARPRVFTILMTGTPSHPRRRSIGPFPRQNLIRVNFTKINSIAFGHIRMWRDQKRRAVGAHCLICFSLVRPRPQRGQTCDEHFSRFDTESTMRSCKRKPTLPGVDHDSITSSARVRIAGGTVTPIASAVFTLTEALAAFPNYVSSSRTARAASLIARCA